MKRLLLLCCLFAFVLVGCNRNELNSLIENGNIASFTDDELREKGLSDEEIALLRSQYTVSGNEIDPEESMYFTDLSQMTAENYMYYVGELPEMAEKGTVYYDLVSKGIMPGCIVSTDPEDGEGPEPDPDAIVLNAEGSYYGDTYHPTIEHVDSKYGKDVPDFLVTEIDRIVAEHNYTNVVLVSRKDSQNDFGDDLVIWEYRMSPCREYDASKNLKVPNYDTYTVIFNEFEGLLTSNSPRNAYENYEHQHNGSHVGTYSVVPESATPTPVPTQVVSSDNDQQTVSSDNNQQTVSSDNSQQTVSSDDNKPTTSNNNNQQTVSSDKDNQQTSSSNDNQQTVTSDNGNQQTVSSDDNTQVVSSDDNTQVVPSDDNQQEVASD